MNRLQQQKKRIVPFKLIVQLFENYFSGKATEQEKDIINKWSLERKKEDLSDIEDTQAEIDGDEIWKKVSETLQFDPSIRTPEQEEEPAGRRFLWHRKWAVAAAVTGILLISGSYLLFKEQVSLPQLAVLSGKQESLPAVYETGIHEQKTLNLPDGSIVTMNAGSRLSLYADQYNKQNRTVYLEEGEAFFEVAKNPEKPFIVHSGTVRTIVKGTSFNVKSYSRLGEQIISVREGVVSIVDKDKQLDELTANRQIIVYKKDGTFKSGQLAWEDAAGWMKGNLVLNHADVQELRLRIRQHFNVELAINGDALKGMVLKSTFVKGTSLNAVLESLSALYGIKYKIENDRVEIYP